MKRRRLKAQSTLEYAFLVAIIAAGVIGMQFYMKRAFQGRAKQAADEIGEPYDSELVRSSTVSTTVTGHVTVHSTIHNVGSAGDEEYAIESNVAQNETVNKAGSEHIGPW